MTCNMQCGSECDSEKVIGTNSWKGWESTEIGDQALPEILPQGAG